MTEPVTEPVMEPVIRHRLIAASLSVLAVWFAIPQASSGEDLYIAFGDSITRASGGPVNPQLVFDGGGCTDPLRDQCACARRLTNDLGGDARVVNEGYGAERTDAGLARLDGVLDARCGNRDPGDCIALLLMEGTNNVTQILRGRGGYSIESTIQDLESMIDVASAHGLDAVLASVPQRAEWTGCDAIDHDATTDELNIEIGNLAGAVSRSFADVAQDPQNGLCKNSNACFENHYFCDDIHIDPSGYDRLCDVFLAQIEATPLPVAPPLTAPNGLTTDTKPDFVWTDLVRATWYQLEVDGDSTWHDASMCSAGTCSIAPYTLSEGPHSWRVRARNLLGYGPWSATVEFSIYVAAPQTAPEPLSPSTPQFTRTPLFVWQETPSAETYTFEVEDSSQNIDATAIDLLASDVCDNGICSYLEGTPLAVDTYTWSIQAENPLGASPTSSAMSFDIIACPNDSQRDAEQLQPSPILGNKTVDWCGRLTAGAMGAYVVNPSGNLVLHSRDSVTLHNGFQVWGRLEIQVDR